MIEVQNITKNYGPFQALKDISFQVGKGQIVGFLGPNGAGKTTTMRILTCFMPASSGRVTIAGYDVFKESREVRKRIGYLPENVPLYPEMTVTKYLKYMAKIRSVPRGSIKAQLDNAIEACGLTERRHQIIGQLSRGFRQRVGLAQALIHEPDVLILDEPTSGLDPRQIVEIRELIKALGKERTILFSTHILPEASMTCERLIIISRGEITGDVQLEDGRAVSKQNNTESVPVTTLTLSLEIAGAPADDILTILTGIPDVIRVEQTGVNTANPATFHLHYTPTTDIRAKVAETIVGRGWQLLEMHSTEISLEELFLSLTV
ncbi:ATP-binding cassette domain-containing protein [Candidatus Poribacteria bacterium]|nr:ATP-binding cassette domain-containing protein [Candidatus Poribacteria bacterium]MYG05473.1 ATP-binding cassette domain-containing protein [Candidatus Poribacteria bacterium]MYK23036.1 ATP-binding cassette domain-containing protein [Candidatus Poribacteria bacterium]